MRKIAFFVVLFAVILAASISFAGVREGTDSEGKSNFASIAVTGIDNSGVPGYIEFTSAASTPAKFYLWVGTDGKLRIASEAVVGRGASPSYVYSWSNTSGTVVGSQ